MAGKSALPDARKTEETRLRETGTVLMPRFDASGLMPAIAVDATSGAVLMLAFMNAEALALCLETGEAHYYSRSRQAIWRKGASSGEIQEIVEMLIDCDQDSLLLRVRQKGGGCCHVGYRSCFYRRIEGGKGARPHLVFAGKRKDAE